MAFLEMLLRANPALLLRGMSVPSPVDPPIETQNYDIHLSDADIFFWHRDLVFPIPPAEDQLEARVTFHTDEFGFPNPAPSPPQVDVIVLGRSYSLGAQAAKPWPNLLAEHSNRQVLNLSQTGSDIEIKSSYLQRFGLPRHPDWVIVEVLPSMDIIGYHPRSKLIIQDLPFSITHQLIVNSSNKTNTQSSSAYIYPLAVDIPNQTVHLTFFSHYLAALTVNRSMLENSNQWAIYRQKLIELTDLAQASGARVALLYAPTKPDIYVPMAQSPEQILPALQGLVPWNLDADNNLFQDSSLIPDIVSMQANASAGRDLVADFASQNRIPFIDPSPEMIQAVFEGKHPFMTYDTHWSALGHQIVSQVILSTVVLK